MTGRVRLALRRVFAAAPGWTEAELAELAEHDADAQSLWERVEQEPDEYDDRPYTCPTCGGEWHHCYPPPAP